LSAALPLVVILALTGIAALHAWWGFGGRWPARDEASLADLVIGSPSGRMPPPAACFAVAAAILVGVALVVTIVFLRLPPQLDGVARLAYGAFAAVFLLRGLAGFFPTIWRYSDGTRFQKLNTRYYSPLCLLIALGLGLSLGTSR
jgi:Protein of unknown function (DUF3995)